MYNVNDAVIQTYDNTITHNVTHRNKTKEKDSERQAQLYTFSSTPSSVPLNASTPSHPSLNYLKSSSSNSVGPLELETNLILSDFLGRTSSTEVLLDTTNASNIDTNTRFYDYLNFYPENLPKTKNKLTPMHYTTDSVPLQSDSIQKRNHSGNQFERNPPQINHMDHIEINENINAIQPQKKFKSKQIGKNCVIKNSNVETKENEKWYAGRQSSPSTDISDTEEVLYEHPHGQHLVGNPEGILEIRSSQIEIGHSDSGDTENLEKFWPRVTWLVVLLIAQSLISVILQEFQSIVRHHPVIIYFLTMLVGSGGNAGSQSTVLVIRGIAVGKYNKGSYGAIIWNQCKVGVAAASVLTAVSFLRTYFFEGDHFEVLAVCVSMYAIVLISVLIGTLLPIGFKLLKIDPAHAGAAIQVLMDLFGVTITCMISHIILDRIAPIIDSTYQARHAAAEIAADLASNKP